MPPSPRPEGLSRFPEIERLTALLATDPQSKAFMPLAEEYGKAGLWQEAATVLEEGLKAYPGFITAMVALGYAYDQLGQTERAKAILEDAVKMSPDNLRAHRTLAKIYAGEGAKESALRSCSVILAVNPLDEEALALKSVLDKQPSASPDPVATVSHSPEDRHERAASPEEQGAGQPALADLPADAPAPPTDPASGKLARLENVLRTIQLRREN